MTYEKDEEEKSDEDEVQAYLKEAMAKPLSNPLEYWQARELADEGILSHTCLICSWRKEFSVGGKICRPDRSRLHNSNIEDLVVIRCNRWLLC